MARIIHEGTARSKEFFERWTRQDYPTYTLISVETVKRAAPKWPATKAYGAGPMQGAYRAVLEPKTVRGTMPTAAPFNDLPPIEWEITGDTFTASAGGKSKSWNIVTGTEWAWNFQKNQVKVGSMRGFIASLTYTYFGSQDWQLRKPIYKGLGYSAQ